MDAKEYTIREISSDKEKGKYSIEVTTNEGFVTPEHFMFTFENKKQLQEHIKDLQDTLTL